MVLSDEHLPQFSSNFQRDSACRDNIGYSCTSPTPNTICFNMTTATDSCDFCGAQGSDPDFPCLLGCTRIPMFTTPTKPISEFIEPGTCEYSRLVSKQVCDNSSIVFYHFCSQWPIPLFFTIFIIFHSIQSGTCEIAVENMGLTCKSINIILSKLLVVKK